MSIIIMVKVTPDYMLVTITGEINNLFQKYLKFNNEIINFSSLFTLILKKKNYNWLFILFDIFI